MSVTISRTYVKMDATFGISLPTDYRTPPKLAAPSLPDATGSLINHKNKFMQLARRLRHTLNSSTANDETKKRPFQFKSCVTSPADSHCTINHPVGAETGNAMLVVPSVGALAVAAAAAVAAPAPNAIVNFAQLTVATNSLHLPTTNSNQLSSDTSSLSPTLLHDESCLDSPLSNYRSSSAITSSCSPDRSTSFDQKRTYRHFCGIRLPTSNNHQHPHQHNSKPKSTLTSSNGSSRASSISSHNSGSTCSSTSSTVSSNPHHQHHQLSLLQTLALCSLELAAPALHHGPSISPRSSVSLSSSPFERDHCFDLNCSSSQNVSTSPMFDPCATPDTPREFIQLSGHQDGFRLQADGRVWKKITDGAANELLAYERLNHDPFMRNHVATFYGEQCDPVTGQRFVELADLLQHFRRPAWLMDIKMGSRTFLEKEVLNAEARPDLFEKMEKTLLAGGPEVADRKLLTSEECEQRALTKLRYMSLREQLSSSSTLGFRVEAYKCNGNNISKDLQYVRQADQIQHILRQFLPANPQFIAQLIDRLEQLRSDLINSPFFARHELIGSSLLIVHDQQRIGVWMIDFAKTIPLPQHIRIDHRSDWQPGNHEDGYLLGLDNLISTLKSL